MNSYGQMQDTLRRTAAYQGVVCNHMPGYGPDCYRLGVKEGDVYLEDIFYIKNDGQLNAAINSLTKRALMC